MIKLKCQLMTFRSTNLWVFMSLREFLDKSKLRRPMVNIGYIIPWTVDLVYREQKV